MPEAQANQAQANRAQAELWNQASGQAWVDLQAILDRMLAPVKTRLIEAAFPGEGARVLDIGCGAGATTLAMARRLGPEGFCLGADISAPLVAAAKARAAAEGLGSVAFIEADAQTWRFEPEDFDAVISRFGVMFFDDPPAAFANIRGAVRPGGRLTFAAWRSPMENPFMVAPTQAAARLLPPMPPADPEAPGQFAFADGERVRRILDAAGWTDIDIRPVDIPTEVAEGDVMVFLARLGPVGQALREADHATREAVTAALREGFAPYVQDGVARFVMACWLATARA